VSARLWPAVCGAALLVGLAPSTSAAPLNLARMDGLRGDPVNDGPFALYWNPAAVTRPGFSLGLHLQAVHREATYDRIAAWNDVPADEAEVNAGRSHVRGLGVIPALSVGHGWSFGDFDAGIAGGWYLPLAGVADWDKRPDAPSEVPGAYDGVQRWATIYSRLVIQSIAVALGGRHRPSGLSIGLSPVLHLATLDTLRARNVDRTDDLVDIEGNPKEGRLLFESNDVAFGYIAGLRWEAPASVLSVPLVIGLTWTDVPELTMDGTARIAYGTAEPFTLDARLPFPLADTLRLGVSVGLSRRVTLRPTFEWARWSVLDRQVALSNADDAPLLEIERAFSDAYTGKLRGDIVLTDALTLLVGGGFERGPTPTKTHEPGLAEGDNWEAGAGLRARLSERISLTSSFFWHHFPERTVRDSIQQPSVNGVYTDHRRYLTLDLEVH